MRKCRRHHERSGRQSPKHPWLANIEAARTGHEFVGDESRGFAPAVRLRLGAECGGDMMKKKVAEDDAATDAAVLAEGEEGAEAAAETPEEGDEGADSDAS